MKLFGNMTDAVREIKELGLENSKEAFEHIYTNTIRRITAVAAKVAKSPAYSHLSIDESSISSYLSFEWLLNALDCYDPDNRQGVPFEAFFFGRLRWGVSNAMAHYRTEKAFNEASVPLEDDGAEDCWTGKTAKTEHAAQEQPKQFTDTFIDIIRGFAAKHGDMEAQVILCFAYGTKVEQIAEVRRIMKFTEYGQNERKTVSRIKARFERYYTAATTPVKKKKK